MNNRDGFSGKHSYHFLDLSPATGIALYKLGDLKDEVGGPSSIPPAKVALPNKAAIAACDKDDGLEDGSIVDPTKCKFDPATIQCKGADSDFCLTAAQVDTAKKIYLIDPRIEVVGF
jgi:hypothetical protein